MIIYLVALLYQIHVATKFGHAHYVELPQFVACLSCMGDEWLVQEVY